MRAGVISALAAAASGVAAHETFGRYPGRYEPSGCGALRGCDPRHKGQYFPDPKSFYYPNQDYERGNGWDLCRDRPTCRPEEAYSRVNFDFAEEELVFNFEEREELIFEEVEIFVATEGPRFDENNRFGSHRGNCHRDPNNRYRCNLPYENFLPNGNHGLCPNRGHEAFIFYIKIRSVVRVREERFQLFNRAVNERVSFDDYRRLGARSYGGSEQYYDNSDYNNYFDENSSENDYFKLGYACSECKFEEFEKECCSSRDQNKEGCESCSNEESCCRQEPCYEKKPCCKEPCRKEPCPKPCSEEKCYNPCSHCPSQQCRRKPQHPRGELYSRAFIDDDEDNSLESFGRNRGNNRGSKNGCCREEDYECEGVFVKAFGTGENTYPFSDLARRGYPNSCGRNDGYYQRYPKNDLEVAVTGPIALDNKEFGFFAVQLKKRGNDAYIFVEIDIKDVDYFVAEVAVFVECDGGKNDDFNADSSSPNICRPNSYPNRHVDETGIEEFQFEIEDDFKCEGDYFIAIYVLVCVKNDNNNCFYRRA